MKPAKLVMWVQIATLGWIGQRLSGALINVLIRVRAMGSKRATITISKLDLVVAVPQASRLV